MSTRAPAPGRPASLGLIGYRATGKSTVGRLLASHLGYDFVDADHALEERHGLSIPEIFRTHGEQRFRDWEAEVLADLTARSLTRPTVLATGGGVVLRPENRAVLRRLGTLIWLAADTSEIAARLGRDPHGTGRRPALTAAGTIEEVSELMKQREPIYRDLADLTVDTDGRTPEAVAESILAHLAIPAAPGDVNRPDWKGHEPRC